MYSNCVMSFVLYPTKSEYCCNILQTQTEQFKSSLYHCLSHSLSLVILEKVYIYSYAFWADFKSVSVICVNRRLWDENPLRSKCFSSLVLLCKSSVRIGSFSFEVKKLLCFNICSYFKKTWSYLRTIDLNRE